jgi:hypothetical protein
LTGLFRALRRSPERGDEGSNLGATICRRSARFARGAASTVARTAEFSKTVRPQGWGIHPR